MINSTTQNNLECYGEKKFRSHTTKIRKRGIYIGYFFNFVVEITFGLKHCYCTTLVDLNGIFVVVLVVVLDDVVFVVNDIIPYPKA
jgi:hypothetical protein